MLRIEHLTKNYGEKKAVDDLNLHIAPGEIYGFIGHNGAGKAWNDFEQNRLRLQRDRRCWFRCRNHQYGFGCRYGAELREYTQTA